MSASNIVSSSQQSDEANKGTEEIFEDSLSTSFEISREEGNKKEYVIPSNPNVDNKIDLKITLSKNENGDWVYSEKLNRIYTKIEKIVPFRFTWEPVKSNVYLRTKLVYVQEQYKDEPVRRCATHTSKSNLVNRSMDQERINHIIHCTNQTASLYEEKNGHLSLSLLCQPGSGAQYVSMCFKFFCKNSCASMSRRDTEIEFSIENDEGRILALQKVGIKICSLPKRDKVRGEDSEQDILMLNKEFESLTTNKNVTAIQPCDDTNIYNIKIDVVGKDNYLLVHKYAYDIMAGKVARTGQHDHPNFKQCMEKILKKINID